MSNPEAIIQKVVAQIAKEQNFVDYDLKIKTISSGGANYTSILFNVTLSEGNRFIHMFAKFACIGEKIRADMPKVYDTEIFAYTKLINVYKRLEAEHYIPQKHRLVFPKFYGCNPKEYEETVVLENLVIAGYQPFNRFETVDWEYTKTALSDLAKMHALGFAYSEYLPEEFNTVKASLKPLNMEGEEAAGYFKIMVDKAVNVTHQEHKESVQKFFDLVDASKFGDYFKCLRRPTLIHGDYRPSNLMHKIEPDGSVDIKIVDLQTLQGGSPVTDLLYFIFTGTDEQFRIANYQKLLDHYLTELHAALRRLDLDPEKVYSREDFEYELNEKLPFGLTIAVFALPIVTVQEEDAPKVDNNTDISSFSVSTSELYAERLNGVINDYVKWGILK